VLPLVLRAMAGAAAGAEGGRGAACGVLAALVGRCMWLCSCQVPVLQ
jgi:hypothetical protein